ncbi:MAG: GatB/YqeY domain-containing protein [Bdellovibrionota bacterium]
MALKERLLEDIKIAMKAKQPERLEVLRFLNAAIKNREIELRPNPVSDSEVMVVIQKLTKQRIDSIEQFRAANREDLASKEESELVILKEYLPKQLSEAEVKELVQASITEAGASTIKDMGKVMKLAAEKAQGRADNKLLSQYIKEKLS